MKIALHILQVLEKIAVIVAAGVAAYSAYLAVGQLKELVAQTRVQSDQARIQNETLKETRLAESAALMLQIDEQIDGKQFASIRADIEEHDHTYPLYRRGGKHTPRQLQMYLDHLDDVGLLSRKDLILEDMTYNAFSYYAEKAWCNADVQDFIKTARASTPDAIENPFYEHFEWLGREFLRKDGSTCADVDKE